MSTSEDKGNIAGDHSDHGDSHDDGGHSETVAPFVSESSWQDGLLACLSVLALLALVVFMGYWSGMAL